MGFLAPVMTAIGGFLGSALGKVVVGLGLNVVMSKIERDRAKKAQKATGGAILTKEYGEDLSRKVACGLVGLAGHDCYANAYGASNKYLEQLYIFSDYPCDGLSRIWAGGKLLTIASNDGKNYTVTTGDYVGRMSFVFYDGTQTAADAGLIGNGNPIGRWTDKHVGVGQCYIIARLTYDQERLAQFPEFFFEIRGARLYDIRKDSTMGGSGPHRWGDYSTYEFTECPIVMEYNYRRGFIWGVDEAGRPDLFLGMEMPASDLPFDRYVLASNICDEFEGGEPRYRCSIILDADLEHRENIDALMLSCGGIVIDSVEGSWPLIGTEQPIVATFTDGDLVAGERVRFRRYRSQGELVNVVSGTYVEPNNMWSPAGYDPQTHAGTVGIDRRTRDVPLSFPQVRSKRQANQLASIYFNENRYEATADLVLRPGFRNLKAGDWVFWDSENPLRRRVFMVQSRSIRALDSDGPRNVALSLQERDGAIYAGVGVNPPPLPIPNGEPVYLNVLPDWVVFPVLSVGPDGRTYPAFRMSWSPFDDVTVTGIQFRYWKVGEPENAFYREVPADQTIAFLQEGVVGLQIYAFQHKLIAPGRVTVWSDETLARSLDGGNGDLDVHLGDLNNEVIEQFKKLFQELGDQRPLLERLMENWQSQTLVTELARRRLQASLESSSAYFDEQIAVMAGELEAVAEQATAIGATVGDITAQGLIKFAVAANQTGVDARFAVLLRGSSGLAYKESGFFLELYTELGVQKSRFSVMADQFIITNGVVGHLPIVIENGELKLNIANIGTIRAGSINFGNGRVIIDANGIVVTS